MPDTPAARTKPPEHTSVKETLISITIAFAMAFVFRAFVIEAYVIPTGSMAPTLMGQHMRFDSPQTGYDWAVNPWQYDRPGPNPTPLAIQTGITVHDPMSGWTMNDQSVLRRSGDRILVLKFLRHVFEASRFDVVVFKAPHEPQTNYIKRLLGLPGEQVALVDGDLFTRKPQPADPTGPEVDTWSLPGWEIARKGERTQREVWQPVFDSAFTPNNPVKDGRPWFTSPWTGGDARWQIAGLRSYRYDGQGPTRLNWDNSVRPINDRYAYNETPMEGADKFPVSDIRLSCGLQPDAAGVSASAVIKARDHEFRAEIAGAKASVQMRQSPRDSAGGEEWKTLATEDLSAPLAAGQITDIEFWHVDQSLQLWVDGSLVVHAEYDWTPPERVAAAMGISLKELLERNVGTNPFADTNLYQDPEVRWEFTGGPFTLHRVALARDLYYRADVYRQAKSRAGHPAAATHPYSTPTLSEDQFFTCGDNSPASLDARLWDKPDPFVAAEIDPTQGVVPRDLMLGKAFFVYFPSATEVFGYRAIPDFRRFRWIW